MSIELAISIVALLVAILSALYARHSVVEARNANRIASHQHKRAILDVARNFKGAFRVHAEDIDETLVYALLEAANNASLYFTRPVAEHLSRYADAAYAALIARDGAKRLQSINREVPPEKWEYIFKAVDSCREIEGDLLVALEAETKIVE